MIKSTFFASLALALCAFAVFDSTARADVSITVRPPFSNPPFAATSGATVSYTPANGIDLTVPSGFPQPNTDVENDNMFGVSVNYGGTGYTVLTSRHVFENSSEIALTVSSLGVGQAYEVFVQTFVNTGSDLYGGRYGFASGQLTTYSSLSGGTLLATGTNGPGGQGQFQVREFDLGTHLALGGQLTFYFDDFNGASRVGDFAGLRLVSVPEPTSALLLLSGVASALAWYARRRSGSKQGFFFL